MEKVIKLLKLFFIFVLSLVLYFLFCPKCHAWTTNPDNNTIAKLSTGATYEDLEIYSYALNNYTTIKYPSDHKFNGADIMFICDFYTNSQPNGTNYAQMIVTYIPSADTGYPYAQPTISYDYMVGIGVKSSAQTLLLMFYDNGNSSFTSYVANDHSYPCFAFWLPYYNSNGDFLGYYCPNISSNSRLNIDSNNILVSYLPIYNFVKVNNIWTIDSTIITANGYPTFNQPVSYEFSSPAYDLSNMGKGINGGMSFTIKNFDIDEVQPNLFVKIALYKDTITRNNETTYLYNIYLLPIMINYNWVGNIVDIQQSTIDNDNYYGNIYTNYFIYSGLINDIDRNQPVVRLV